MNPPKEYLQLLEKCKGSLERPDFHPERYLDAHIKIVVSNAHKTGNSNIIMAAKIHDIFKPVSGDMKKDSTGRWYWSNPAHATQAAEWILVKDDVKHWCWISGADWRKVEGIVRHHMIAKNFGKMKKSTLLKYSRICGTYWNELVMFSKCDDMLGERF